METMAGEVELGDRIQVEHLAYRIWELRGRPESGTALDDWFLAERLLSEKLPTCRELSPSRFDAACLLVED